MNLGERWAAAWSSHDVDGLVALFAPGCEYEDAAFGVVNSGLQGVREWTIGFLSSFPDLEVVPKRAFEDALAGAVEWEMSGTHDGEFAGLAPTGRRFRVDGATVLTIEGGRIVRCADYWNLGDVLDQLRG